MLKRLSLAFCILFSVVAASACVSARGTVLNVGGPLYPKVAPAEVRVFLSEADVSGEFEKVALLRGRGSDFSGSGKILNALKKKAAELGANGLILGELKTPGAMDRVASVLVGLGGLGSKKWTAVAIRFKSAG